MISTVLRKAGNYCYKRGYDRAADFFYRWARRFGARMEW